MLHYSAGSAKNYLFFVQEVLPKAAAHLVQVAQSANGAANLGYPTVLTCFQSPARSNSLRDLLMPFRPQQPDATFRQFYSLQERLQVAQLPLPDWAERGQTRFNNPSTLVCKHYLPLYIAPITQLVHTRDWNFLKAALRQGIPVVYEHHHHSEMRFDPKIVNHPLFQIAVTVIDTVRESMIDQGMPPEKVIRLPNGFNHIFCDRQPEAIHTWRQRLLANESQALVVYAGALQPFKGIDILLTVAQQMPEVQFALAGGTVQEIAQYRDKAQALGLFNIKLLGHLPQQDLASLLQAANLLAHPHCSGKAATFTSPLKLFDYMASGTPIVATEIVSLREFQGTEAIARWCATDSADQFAQALREALAQYPYRLQGYPESVAFVQQFSWENRAQRILEHVQPEHRPQLIA